MEERLQKIIARAGICSRREAEQLIESGQVTVNGDIVTELGSKADPEKDHIKVRGKLIQQDEKQHYILLNKPKGVISTVNDPEGRPSVVELITGLKARIYPVGRLDFNTEGVLLLTNDGELANRLLSPSFKCPKTYLVKVSGTPQPKEIARLERGITVDGTRYGSCEIEILRVHKNTWAKVTLMEGKNHQVKKMFEAIGHPVSKLRRIAFAFLTAKGVEVGKWRHLTDVEVARLKRNDFKPLVPVSATPFLKEAGVRVSLKDRERLVPYRAEQGQAQDKIRPTGKTRKPADKPGEKRSSKWAASSTRKQPGSGKFSDSRRTSGKGGNFRRRDEEDGKPRSKWRAEARDGDGGGREGRGRDDRRDGRSRDDRRDGRSRDGRDRDDRYKRGPNAEGGRGDSRGEGGRGGSKGPGGRSGGPKGPGGRSGGPKGPGGRSGGPKGASGRGGPKGPGGRGGPKGPGGRGGGPKGPGGRSGGPKGPGGRGGGPKGRGGRPGGGRGK